MPGHDGTGDTGPLGGIVGTLGRNEDFRDAMEDLRDEWDSLTDRQWERWQSLALVRVSSGSLFEDRSILRSGSLPALTGEGIFSGNPSGHSAAPTSSRRVVGEVSGEWEWRGFAWAHEDRDKEHLGVLDSAMEQINDSLTILEDFESETGVEMDTVCMRQMLMGTDDWYGQVHLRPFEGEETRTEPNPPTSGFTYGKAAPILTTVWLNQHYVRAVANSRKAFGCGEGDGDCSCMIADVAGTIVHETAHICLQTENGAYALGQYYLFRFKQNKGWSSGFCCGYDWGDWAPQHYTTEQAMAMSRQVQITVWTLAEPDGDVLDGPEWRVSPTCDEVVG